MIKLKMAPLRVHDTATGSNVDLDCIAGPQGPQGPQGIQGPQGPQGPAGYSPSRVQDLNVIVGSTAPEDVTGLSEGDIYIYCPDL